HQQYHLGGWQHRGLEQRVGDADERVAATASFTYNALGQAVEKNISNGSDYREMYYDPSGRMSLLGNNVTNLEDYFPAVGGRNYGKYQSSKTYFMHSNPLGNTGMLTYHTAGAPLQDELYYPWGQRWTLVGTAWDERFAWLEE